ncbi:hypothetical protein [Rhodopirellula baltica]|uniref:hypothetical protein n=1 Tax=Rhodopirellula baltica TaxID=265606 RepID=UPI00056C0830|nr:hypothetical protein [Rhodopirellula baltica]
MKWNASTAIVFAVLLTLPSTSGVADEFEVYGTPAVFTVTSEILAKTPEWKIGEGPIPCGIGTAIQVAKERHDKTEFGGFGELHAWSYHRAVLVSADDNRFYWLVTYKGPYDPSLFNGPGGYSYPGARTRYIHYPVLMSGELAPERARNDKPAEYRSRMIKDFDYRNVIETAGWPHLLNDIEEWHERRKDDPFAPAETKPNVR